MPFKITRADGRSNGQVLLEYVNGGEPGRLYAYDELVTALSEGSHKFTKTDVQRVVRQSTGRLLREQQRRLHAVRTVGYRLAPASEHMVLANGDRRRADVQLRKGLDTLRHVRFEEMDENTRRAHEGHLMVTEAIYANQVALDRRMKKVEEAIAALK